MNYCKVKHTVLENVAKALSDSNKLAKKHNDAKLVKDIDRVNKQLVTIIKAYKVEKAPSCFKEFGRQIYWVYLRICLTIGG